MVFEIIASYKVSSDHSSCTRTDGFRIESTCVTPADDCRRLAADAIPAVVYKCPPPRHMSMTLPPYTFANEPGDAGPSSSSITLLSLIPCPAQLVILHISRRRIKLQIPLNHLVHARQKVFLRRDLPPRPYRKHPRLRRHTPQLRTRAIRTQPRDQLPPNIPLHAHLLCMDPQDIRPALEIRQRELDFPIDTPRPHERGIERGGAVGGEHDFDIPP